MLENGFIKLWRSLLKWEWYDDINTKTVFIHLLLTVSIEDSTWHGIEVKRGCRVSSYAKLAKETSLTIDQTRTALKHLESTGEITRESHKATNGKFTVFRVNNYDKFQSIPRLSHETSQDFPTQLPKPFPQEIPKESQQYKKVKEEKNGRREKGAPAAQNFLTFGEYKNVRLTQKQLDDLVNEFGEGNVKNYITHMDEYVQSNGRPPYSDCYLKLRNWMNEDGVVKDSFDVEKYKAFINNFQEDFHE